MSAEEPLYCPVCGREWGVDPLCDCNDAEGGPYCHVCGVIPAPGGECKFFKAGGNETGCEVQA